MKLKYISAAALAAVSVLLSSCVEYPGQFGTVAFATDGYNSSVGWSSARYDANGFPIFGYSHGRPVYGYSDSGAAIFSIAALTALCFVPDWKPAPWYRGHHHHPIHCHRVAAPPRHFHVPSPAPRPLAARPLLKPELRPAIAPRPQQRPAAALRPAVSPRPLAGHKPGVAPRPLQRPSAALRPLAGHKPVVAPHPVSRSRVASHQGGSSPSSAAGRPGGTRIASGHGRRR